MQDSISLEKWNELAHFLTIGLVCISLVILLGHLLRLMATRDLKSKYDYINRYEINLLWWASVGIITAAAVYANSLSAELQLLLICVRAFVAAMMAMIVGVIVQNLLKFYYPFFIEKRLKKLRFQPRISPKSGKPMKLLSEDEEDVYLDEGMQAEENIFSIDYDVWIDEETGYTKIEKYSGHLHADQCPECSYQTMRVVKEEIIKSPGYDEEGQLEKYYNCGYCSYKTKKAFKIAPLRQSSAEAAV